MVNKFFSTRILVLLLVLTGSVALFLRFQVKNDLDIYSLNKDIALKRIDYFSHYQLLDVNEDVLMDFVEQIGIDESFYLFINQKGDVLLYNRNDGNLSELSADNLSRFSAMERYTPWSITDNITDNDNLRFGLKLSYIAFIIILTALVMKWIRRQRAVKRRGK